MQHVRCNAEDEHGDTAADTDTTSAAAADTGTTSAADAAADTGTTSAADPVRGRTKPSMGRFYNRINP